MSAIGHLTDICACNAHVRFRGQSGHRVDLPQCLLMTQSGHRGRKVLASKSCISRGARSYAELRESECEGTHHGVLAAAMFRLLPLKAGRG
jgi:hypothetical protein